VEDGTIRVFVSQQGNARGLVTLEQMVTALVTAAENPAQGIKVLRMPEIRLAAA